MTEKKSILAFIEKSKCIDILNVDKGYKVTCYMAETDKWNAPQCTIWITDCILPEPQYGIEVEYRKQLVFKSDSKEITDEVRDRVASAYKKLTEDKKTALQNEFETHLDG